LELREVSSANEAAIIKLDIGSADMRPLRIKSLACCLDWHLSVHGIVLIGSSISMRVVLVLNLAWVLLMRSWRSHHLMVLLNTIGLVLSALIQVLVRVALLDDLFSNNHA